MEETYKKKGLKTFSIFECNRCKTRIFSSNFLTEDEYENAVSEHQKECE